MIRRCFGPVGLCLGLVLCGNGCLHDSNAPGARPTKLIDLGAVGASEGPAWHPSGYLLFTGGGHITKRTAQGELSIFRADSGGANGLLFDAQGRLVVCESGQRRVTRTEPDGTIVVLADRYQGHRFNTPNDLTIDSKGRIYFTDPRYGPRDNMEMTDENGRLIEGVYRIDGPGQVTRILSEELSRPNGILVAPGDHYLYVADNVNDAVEGARKLWRFDLLPDGSVDPKSRKLIFDWKDARGPDGLKIDQVGRLYVAAGLNKANPPYETADHFTGGIYVLSPQGRLLEFISIPNDEVTNCAFGGADLKTLFITAGGHLWSWRIDTPGVVTFPPK
ncbi:MAG TPA: SMP-30/gluconolactonase/LRE family protein [Candidatus Dormibacteraeota bacterium]|nr:SMP-30/gluconolactonase/LRE family protein [Candidatus Dormibacteraeota bacterium]